MTLQENTALAGIAEHRSDRFLIGASQQGGLRALADDVDLATIHVVVARDHEKTFVEESIADGRQQARVEPLPGYLVVFPFPRVGNVAGNRHQVGRQAPALEPAHDVAQAGQHGVCVPFPVFAEVKIRKVKNTNRLARSSLCHGFVSFPHGGVQ